MEKNIISRREFFKGAAKKALPIVGAVMLASMPNIANAQTTINCAEWNCTGGCRKTCTGCQESCEEGCKGCKGTAKVS